MIKFSENFNIFSIIFNNFSFILIRVFIYEWVLI